MPVTKLSISAFLELASLHPCLDVRSPGEYAHAQIPGALSLSLFSDEERKVVGTAYKQQGKQTAIKIGLDFFGVKMRGMVEAASKIIEGHKGLQDAAVAAQDVGTEAPISKNIVLVHCWRGGMRSAAVAWLLDLYGFEVYTLVGGYKTYRNWVLRHFEDSYAINILGGYTGSGKTGMLRQLKTEGQQVIDLERLANHKGSTFGGIGQGPQPTQEMFENLLATQLSKTAASTFWIEDESQRIGKLNIPHSFWITMRTKQVFFMEIPFEERLQNIVKEYGACDSEQLKVAIQRIQKRLGPLETKTTLLHLQENNLQECFRILLAYYDKSYGKSLQNRENIERLLNKIPALTVDSMSNVEKVILCSTANT